MRQQIISGMIFYFNDQIDYDESIEIDNLEELVPIASHHYYKKTGNYIERQSRDHFIATYKAQEGILKALVKEVNRTMRYLVTLPELAWYERKYERREITMLRHYYQRKLKEIFSA